jgi:hypothetical protein
VQVLSSPTRLNSCEKRLPKFADLPDRYKQAFSLGIFTSHFHFGAKQQAAQMGYGFLLCGGLPYLSIVTSVIVFSFLRFRCQWFQVQS